MRGWIRASLALLLSAGMLLGCSSDVQVPTEPAGSDSALLDDEGEWGGLTGELTIWVPEPVLAGEARNFETKHEGVRVRVVNLQSKTRLTDYYLDALAEGTGPDLLVLTHRMAGAFNTIGKLDNLLEQPYEGGKYMERMSGDFLKPHLSLDGSKLISLPLQDFPLVTIYRPDLMRAAGFPDEPEALAAYMEDPDNWVRMAEKLHEEGRYVTQWPDELMNLLSGGHYFLDRDMNYHMDSPDYRNVMKVTKQARTWSASQSIYDAAGQRSLREDKFAMLHLPAWGVEILNGIIPEQAGKWRVTRLPLGLTGISLDTGKSIAIPSDSKHKQLAWAFIDEVMRSSSVLNWYDVERGHDFLGGQRVFALYDELLRTASPDVPTPFDSNALEIWNNAIKEAVYNEVTTPDEAMDNIRKSIMAFLSNVQQQIRKYAEQKGIMRVTGN